MAMPDQRPAALPGHAAGRRAARLLGRPALGLVGIALAALLLAGAAGAAEIQSYAIVQDDASLRVQGKTIRLFGIYLPSTSQNCRADFRPPICGDRAARVLEVLIRGFVRCLPQAKLADGSISAICYTDASSITQPPIDLGARLIEEGLALARPEAPFEYHALERLAEANGRGLWGFQVDRIIR
jgi:endonuclease YncB( thermonuclease family)